MAIQLETAINEMLEAVGQSPLVTGSFVPDQYPMTEEGRAYTRLKSKSKEIQARGYPFNTRTNVVATPAVPSGHIDLGANVLSVDFTGESSNGSIIMRGTKLFDRTNSTDGYVFESPVTIPLVVDYLEWDFLPEVAQRYILVTALISHATRTLGDTSIGGFYNTELTEAKFQFERYAINELDAGLFDNLSTNGRS